MQPPVHSGDGTPLLLSLPLSRPERLARAPPRAGYEDQACWQLQVPRLTYRSRADGLYRLAHARREPRPPPHDAPSMRHSPSRVHAPHRRPWRVLRRCLLLWRWAAAVPGHAAEHLHHGLRSDVPALLAELRGRAGGAASAGGADDEAAAVHGGVRGGAPERGAAPTPAGTPARRRWPLKGEFVNPRIEGRVCLPITVHTSGSGGACASDQRSSPPPGPPASSSPSCSAPFSSLPCHRPLVVPELPDRVLRVWVGLAQHLLSSGNRLAQQRQACVDCAKPDTKC